MAARRRRWLVRAGTVTWFDRVEIQARWQLPAGRVHLEARDPTWSLDAAYESAVVQDTGDFVEAMQAAGAEVTGSGGRRRP